MRAGFGRTLAVALAGMAVGTATAEASLWQRVAITDPGCQSDITAIEYQAADRLWFTTINGEICRSVGGAFRNELSAGAGEHFTHIEFQPGGNVGIAVGRNGLLYRSTDSGDNWTAVNPGISNSKFECRTLAGPGTGMNADFTHVRFATATIVFAFGDARQIFRSDNAGQTWNATWNRYDPKNTGINSDDECRYDGKVEDAFFFPSGATTAGVFTGSAGTRLIRSLANATSTNSGLEPRPQGACDTPGGCVLAGDPAGPHRQVAIDAPSGLRGTGDQWATAHQAVLPNRGTRAYPDVLDLDYAGGTTLVTGRGGQILNSTDDLKRAFYLDPPDDVKDVDFNAVSLASPSLAAVGGSRGVLLLTERANADVVKPVIGPVAGPAEIGLGQTLTLSVNPTDEGHGLDAAGVTWSGPGLDTRTGTSAAWTPAAAGTYTVTVSARDRAGNAADPVSHTFRVLAPPAVNTLASRPAATFRFPRGTGITRPAVRRVRGRRFVSFRASGMVGVPAGSNRRVACSGNVTITVTEKARNRTTRLTRVSAAVSRSTCRFRREVRFPRSRLRGRRVTVALRFAGNSLVSAASHRRTLRLRG